MARLPATWPTGRTAAERGGALVWARALVLCCLAGSLLQRAEAGPGLLPAAAVECSVRCDSAPELGREFEVSGEVRVNRPQPALRVRIVAPSGVETVRPAAAYRTGLTTGTTLSVHGVFRVVSALSGAELRLEVHRAAERSVEPIVGRRSYSASVFLTVTEDEGAAGMPGDLWDRRLPAASGGGAPAYILQGFGDGTLLAEGAGRGAAGEALAAYRAAHAAIGTEPPKTLARQFIEIARLAPPDISAAAACTAAALLALSGELDAALSSWADLLDAKNLPDRIAAYVHYDQAVALAAAGRVQEAAGHLDRALVRNPGLTAARRLRERLPAN